MCRNNRLLLAGIACVAPLQAQAQTASATAKAANAPLPQSAAAEAGRTYSPADFARFAPRTAYDLLTHIPGFNIRSADSNNRGLGQASENVLIDGKRVANKSGGAVEELRRISAGNVDRIEIVEAASLGIAGLTGQVANVMVKSGQKASGQFEWNPNFRPHYSKPNLFGGNVSYSDGVGPIDYTLSIKNQVRRGAFGGPIEITDPLGTLIEQRDEVYHGKTEQVTFSTKFAIDGPGSSAGNVLLAYAPLWGQDFRQYRSTRSDGNDSRRTTRTRFTGWYYDVNADYEFGLGPGRLKLIGVRHFEDDPVVSTRITKFESDQADDGVRFNRKSKIAETVGRMEYGWNLGSNGLRMSFERAFNSLDQRGSLDVLDPAGEFQPTPFPEGTGRVEEIRYEGIATLTRPLGSKLDLQLTGGGEISRLERVDGDLPPRKFFRPKVSFTLGWRPRVSWDANFKLAREVGQISFYDFLDQPNLQQERENSGNPELVPPQSWEFGAEVGRELGKWGKTRLKVYRHWVKDIIDVVPIGIDGQGVGNLPQATRTGIRSVSTIQLDPLGWTGAKLDITLNLENTRVKDPLTGIVRPIGGTLDRSILLKLRHDVPKTEFAYGVTVSHDHFTRYYRPTEVDGSREGPFWVSVYVEHKNIMGLTARAQVGNILNARHRTNRVLYTGYRNTHPIHTILRSNQLIGPIFSLLVKGTL